MTGTTGKSKGSRLSWLVDRAKIVINSWPFKLVGTSLCIWLLVHNIDVGEALETLKSADPALLLVVLALTPLVLLASLVEWGVLVRSNSAIRWTKLTRAFAKSLAPQHLVPTGIGGDAVRIYSVSDEIGTAAAAAASLIARLSSSTAMMIWALVASMQLKGSLGVWAVTMSLLGLVGLAVFWFLCLRPSAAAIFIVQMTKGTSNRAAKSVLRLASELKELRTNPQTLAVCLGVSLVGWGLQFIALFLLAQSVNLNVPWHIFAVAFPFSLVATIAPFALNGYGLREGIVVGILVSAGISASKAAALALLIDLQMMPFVLVSALLWLDKRKERAHRKTSQAEANLEVANK